MISYKGGYKYQLAYDYRVLVPITGHTIKQGRLRLTVKGWLTIKAGYSWDGPSGPAIDSKNFMRGSLVHDAIYQLIRHRRLDVDKYRDTADRLLQTMCIEDGMSRIRAGWVYMALRWFGDVSADPQSIRPIITAP